MLGPHLAERGEAQREHVVKFWMSFAQQEHADQGAVLGARLLPPAADIGAVLMVRHFRGAFRASTCAGSLGTCAVISRWMCSGAMPAPYTDPKLKVVRGPLEKRADAPGGALQTLKDMHAQHTAAMHGSGHLYVAVMAVDPSAQGQKLCSRLMRAACAHADAQGLPIYLETSGARNVAVYERFGFRVEGTHTLRVEGDEEGSLPFEELHAMVRPVGAPLAAVAAAGAQSGGLQLAVAPAPATMERGV